MIEAINSVPLALGDVAMHPASSLHAIYFLAPVLLPCVACAVWLVAWAISQNRSNDRAE